MKRTKRFLAVLMTLTLVMAFVPMTAHAVMAPSGTVTVVVSNDTFGGAAADRQGEFVSEDVTLTPGMTVGAAIQAACDQASITVTGITGGFISEIGGLKTSDGGPNSGWMCAVNNWFSNSSAPLSEPVADGDIISMEYSLNWGADIGSSWNSNDKTLQSLSVDQGDLSPDFASGTHSYTLTLPTGTDGITLTPLATNRNFMVKTFVGGTEYKLSADIPVADGTVLTVTSGDPSWPSMNNGSFGSGAENVAAETYTITIAYAEPVDNGGGEVTVEKDNSPKTGDSDTMIPLAMLLGLIGIGGAVATKRRTN